MDNYITKPQNKSIGILLGLFGSNCFFIKLLLKQVAHMLIHTAHGLAVLLRVSYKHKLVKDMGLQALPVGTGRIFHNPIQRISHLKQLRFAGLVRCPGCLFTAGLSITLGQQNGGVAHSYNGVIENMLLAQSPKILPLCSAMISCLPANRTKAHVYYLVEVCYVVALSIA